jgi:hypothetical protein
MVFVFVCVFGEGSKARPRDFDRGERGEREERQERLGFTKRPFATTELPHTTLLHKTHQH